MISTLKTVTIRLSCQLKRALCSFQNFLLQVFVISCRIPRAFYLHATETDMKIESVEFQHKSANEFSQKEFHIIKLKTIFQVSLFKQIT